MMIMIYYGRNKATTSLKRARRQNSDLDNIEMVTGLGRCAFNSEFIRGDGERPLPKLDPTSH